MFVCAQASCIQQYRRLPENGLLHRGHIEVPKVPRGLARDGNRL